MVSEFFYFSITFLEVCCPLYFAKRRDILSSSVPVFSASELMLLVKSVLTDSPSGSLM